MHRNPSRLAVLVLAAALLAPAGCAQTQPTDFYILSSLPPSAAASLGADADKLSLGVGPVVLPAYLDRPQVVALASSNKLQLAEFDKWAEPLQDNFSRVLAENLSILLGTDRVAKLPQRRATALNYQVTVEVLRFDADLDGTASLIARWNILGKDGKKSLAMRRSSFTETSEPKGDHEAVVAAMSRAVGNLSREIASTLQTLGTK
ncbi:MAG: PqiC family protein [Rhodospirillales bacterium]|nr:PqiC family protein [Rhodospirillales bacterium]MDH3792065.1 PqiC family protein [Rhodospirillales bacterium]MDH3919425.1 PqiC family protein [Rhodospirillales bacterium]MDH3968150.1 PqiC family protein [Rhodospirillales bacterium]